ncbi:MAG: hypothetical protein KAS59_09275, partial [Alphaproteobacteria bacterium]|nr:hypothetical protein [Alphaproteobacteria bacterium]
ATGGTYYLYNNTLIDNYLGINIGAGTAAAKNNIVKGSGDTNAYAGTFAAGTDYNATDGTDDIGEGTNNKTEQTFSFVNETIDNFHLASDDAAARDSGTDLSGDTDLSVSDDIEGDTRLLGVWDIGADAAGDVTWDGSESTDWAVGANWAGGSAPTSVETVIIDGNYTHAPTLDLTSGTTMIKGLSLGENNASVLTLSNGNSTTNKLVVTGDVDIGVNGTLTHTANTTAETHTINMEAANLTIASGGGTIDVNAKGYQSGSGPGSPGAQLGNGASGAGHGGEGGDGVQAAQTGGFVYGAVTAPTNLGSGGGYEVFSSLASGGGAVKISLSGTLNLSGTISANGGAYTGGYDNPGGAGGSVYITANTFAGDGTISANAGNSSTGQCGASAGGRIAVYYTTDSSTVSYQAYGGKNSTATTRMGGAGTIYKKAAAQTNGDLIIDNNDQDNADDAYIGKTLINEIIAFDTLTLQNHGHLKTGTSSNITYTTLNWTTKGVVTDEGGIFALLSGGGELVIPENCRVFEKTNRSFTNITVNGSLDADPINISGYLSINGTMTLKNYDMTSTKLVVPGDVTIGATGTLTHYANTTDQTHVINMETGNLTIASGGIIDVNAKGYQSGSGPGSPGAYLANGASGAGHGGEGGDGVQSAQTGGSVCGSITAPTNLGSGGGYEVFSNLASGGGAVKISLSGSLNLSGTISANGGAYTGSYDNPGGAGGSVYITANTFAGDGTISA